MDGPITIHAAIGSDSVPVGTLWTHQGAHPTASFRYTESWLNDVRAYPLEPALPLSSHTHHTLPKQPLFGSMADSTPDRWGQILIQRTHAAARKNSALLPRDYLLGISDHTRIGALRYSLGNEIYLAPNTDVPPLARLSDLISAAHSIDAGDASPTDLELLLAPGSSLGGARPKANVVDAQGTLFIAKFERAQDTYPIIPWEAATLMMARDSGINVPLFKLHNAGRHTVLLIARFDRSGEKRLGFISALTMLNAADAESGSYVDIADAIRQHSAATQPDLRELWRRMIFTVLVTNTDNHLRNHAFLKLPGKTGWLLSPAYDINPTPRAIKPRILTLPIASNEPTASLDVALSAHAHFGLALEEAKAVMKDVSRITANWRSYAKAVGLGAGDVSFMETAFEHGELQIAAKL
jgi:serine/threonine-protein kinase HipA